MPILPRVGLLSKMLSQYNKGYLCYTVMLSISSCIVIAVEKLASTSLEGKIRRFDESIDFFCRQSQMLRGWGAVHCRGIKNTRSQWLTRYAVPVHF